MKRVEISTKELKDFAITMSWAIPCLFMLLLPWLFERSIAYWPIIVSAVLLSFYFIYSKAIYPIYRVWMLIAGAIGWVNTRIILAFIFYVVIFPIGILLRIFGKLQYKTKEDQTTASYWKTKEIELKKEDLERPF